jgi:NADH-ubiquinone oxidoreductase chain 3
MTLFILFVSIIALLFLFINLVFAPHNPYQEKDSMFECGFHSFQQSRSPFNIAFFIYALVYLLLDLEILLTFPFAVSEYVNNIYGLMITLGFIFIITIGFVYELGKGALKIPSKQHTYTIKNQPLIHISYIKTKTAVQSKNDYNTTLESSVFPFTLNLKNFRKHLTVNNLILGLIGLIVMGLVKTLNIPTYILDFFGLEKLELLEYIIAGFFGLVSRLGFRGIVEGIFLENYATMGGEDPTQGSSLGDSSGTMGSVGGTDTSNLPEKGKQKASSSSDGNRQLEGKSSPESSTQKQGESSSVASTQKQGESSPGASTQVQGSGESSSTSYKKHRAERFTKIFGNQIDELIEEIKKLNIKMEKASDEE